MAYIRPAVTTTAASNELRMSMKPPAMFFG
jgi:hypothetical protein